VHAAKLWSSWQFNTQELASQNKFIMHYANNLLITNTFFRQAKTNRQWTWESPDGLTHNMIDYILISSKWRSSVKNSRAYPSADIGSDHQLLLIANIRLKLKAMRKHTTVQRFDIKKLKSDPLMASKYETEVSSRLTPVIDSFGS